MSITFVNRETSLKFPVNGGMSRSLFYCHIKRPPMILFNHRRPSFEIFTDFFHTLSKTASAFFSVSFQKQTALQVFLYV